MPTDAPPMPMSIEDIVAMLRQIIDAAEGRQLTDEEVARYEELEAQLAVASRDQEIRRRQNAYETPVRSDLHVYAGASTETRTDADRAFESYLRTGIPNADLEYRAQSEGSDAAGGYLVPDGFLRKIVERRVSYGGIAAAAETIQTDSGNPLPFPTITDQHEAEIVAENAAPASGADLVFGVKTLGAYKYVSVGADGQPLKVSVELLQDSAFDLESYLARILGERIARKQAVDFAQGSGTGEPQGLLTGLSSSDTIAGALPTYQELLNATFAVDEAYLAGGNPSWVMHSSILAGIQGLLDGNDRPLLNTSTDGISGKPSRTLLGYPVVVDNAMPSAWATGATPVGTKTIVFGSIRDAYLIRQVKGVTLSVLRELYSLNGQVGFLAWARADAIVQDPFAATAITGANP